ncbi:hypothetical protein [Citrobacter phage Ci1]|nr:hypothetical protein [Citrobacter phage Ci1]
MMLSKYYLKAYALFGKCKRTGQLYGYVEQSFSMGLSATHVRRWPVLAFDAKYDKELTSCDLRKQKEHQAKILEMLERDKVKLSKTYPTLEFFIVRLNSKSCPVDVDWKAYHKADNKYERRNVIWSKK